MQSVYTFPNSQLARVTIKATPYDTGWVHLNLLPQAGLLPRLIRHLQSITNCPPQRTCDNQIIIHDYENLKAIAQILIDKGYIAQVDHKILQEAVHNIQEPLQQRASTANPNISQATKDVIYLVVDDVFDHIFESAADAEQAVTMVRIAQHTDIMANIEKLKHNYPNINENAHTSIIGLWKVFHGQANLESTFTQTQGHLPSLLRQRIHVIDRGVKKFLQKYPDLSNKNLVKMLVAMNLAFKPNYPISPFVNVGPILEAALARQTEEQADELFQSHFPNALPILGMVPKAFQDLQLIGPGPNFPKVEALKLAFDNSAVIEIYLERIRPKATTSLGEQLCNAIIDGDLSCIQDLINNNSELLNAYIDQVKTPLLLTITSAPSPNKMAIITYLADQGASLTQRVNFTASASPLSLAIYHREPTIVQYLFSKGVDPKDGCAIIQDKSGPFTNELKGKLVNAISYVDEQLVKAPEDHTLNEIKLMIERAADPLAHAMEMRLALIEAYRAAERKKAANTASNSTKEHYSASNGVGKNLSVKDAKHLYDIQRNYKLSDQSPLNLEKGLRMAAAKNELKDAALLVIKLGVDANAVDSDLQSKCTALHHAARENHVKIIKLLLRKNANTEIKDAQGNTPLMLAKKNSEAYMLLKTISQGDSYHLELDTNSVTYRKPKSEEEFKRTNNWRALNISVESARHLLPSSLVAQAGRAHQKLLNEMVTVDRSLEKKYSKFFTVLQERKYSLALRTACALKMNSVSAEEIQEVTKLVNILLSYQPQLRFDVNERSQSNGKAAIHYAAERGLEKIYELLKQHRQNLDDFKDKNQKHPEEYWQEYKSSTTCP